MEFPPEIEEIVNRDASYGPLTVEEYLVFRNWYDNTEKSVRTAALRKLLSIRGISSGVCGGRLGYRDLMDEKGNSIHQDRTCLCGEDDWCITNDKPVDDDCLSLFQRKE